MSVLTPEFIVCLNFIVFTSFALYKGWGAFIRFLDDTIKDTTLKITDANTQKEEAASLLKQTQNEFLLLEKSITEMLEKAAAERAEIKKRSQQDIEKILAFKRSTASKRLHRLKSESVQKIQSHIVFLAVCVIERFIRDELDSPDHDIIIDTSIKEAAHLFESSSSL